MAPGGPWDSSPCPERSKRWHGDLFRDIFYFWLISVQKHCVSVLHRDKRGRPAGGRWRAVVPTLTPLVSPHPPKSAIPLLGGLPLLRVIKLLPQPLKGELGGKILPLAPKPPKPVILGGFRGREASQRPPRAHGMQFPARKSQNDSTATIS